MPLFLSINQLVVIKQLILIKQINNIGTLFDEQKFSIASISSLFLCSSIAATLLEFHMSSSCLFINSIAQVFILQNQPLYSKLELVSAYLTTYLLTYQPTNLPTYNTQVDKRTLIFELV